MDKNNSLTKQIPPLFATLRNLTVTVVLVSATASPVQAQNFSGNILPSGSFDDTEPRYVPWAGVDDKGNLHGIDGKQIAVDDAGKIQVDNFGHGNAAFGPGIASADLNGDGKNDLVIADTYGYFWFYPNSGTPAKPVFTQGEIMPIWLAEERVGRDIEGYDNIVPRIQLIDIDGVHKFDILAGTYVGKLFRIPNVGSASAPNFRPTVSRDALEINTHKRGVLWCNYLSPFMTAAFTNQNRLDLIMGEGTYSANSIYWLRDLNSSGTPTYDEDHLLKMIPGMGLEQITPVVVDWNNDGKPDILCGDRTGHLNLYINNSTDPDSPTFLPPVHVKIAGQDQFGSSITVALADLSENKLPNLLIGRNDGTVAYAVNTGKLGDPVFQVPPETLKGVLPPEDHYIGLKQWEKRQAYGIPDELVSAVNPQTEPGFKFPEGEKTKNALKFSVWPVKNTYFPDRYYTPTEDDWRQHIIACTEKFTIKLNKRYRVHFWALADKNTELTMKWWPAFKDTDKYAPPYNGVGKTTTVGTSWTECSLDFRFDNEIEPQVTDWDFTCDFRFTGQPTIYIDDVQIQEAL